MSQQLTITITAKDGTSAVFSKIASAARSMSSAVASSGKSGAGGLKELGSAGTTAAAALSKEAAEASKASTATQKLSSSAKQASGSMDSLADKSTKVGAALGSTVAILAKLGQASVQQQQSIKGIERAYGDAADGVLEFTERLQDSTAFSNEQGRQAAQIAQTLVKNYGMSVEATEELISRSADLATVYGIDLADAVQRTSSAIRGEAESAEFLGISLQDNYVAAQAAARGITGWSTSMTEAEKAAFRMTLLMEQTNYSVGSAGEFAQTSAGQTQQLANRFQDLTVGVGGLLGPLSQGAAGMADMSIALTLGGAAIGKFVGGLTGVGSKMLSLVGMINPVGIAITALVAAGAAVVAAWQINEQANAALADSYTDLNAAIEATMTAQQALVAGQIRYDFDQAGQVDALSESYGIAENAAQDFFNFLGGVTSQFEMMNLTTQEQTKMNELLAQSFTNVSDAGTDGLISAMGKLETEVESFATSGNLAMQALEDLNTALEFNGDGASNVDAAIESLNQSYAAGTIDAQTYADGLDYVATHLDEIAAGADGAAESVRTVNDVLSDINNKLAQAKAKEDVVDGLFGSAARWDAQVQAIRETERAMVEAAKVGTPFEAGFGAEGRGDFDAIQAELDEIAAAEAEVAEQARATAEALRGQLVPALDGASSGFAGFVQPGEDVLDTLARISPNLDNVGGSFLQFADNLNDAKQALDGVLTTFSAIDSLGQGAGSASDIATKLIGDPGTWATVDDLLQSGAISVEQYNDAVASGTSIQANNLAIQEDLNAVRANQLPLLDSQVTKLAAYVDGLADASAAEQQQALYLMDSANQAKVAASYSTAYAASLGEIPPEVATQIIADGAQADPILGSILESFGLIEVGANGVITVNFPTKSVLDDAATAVNNLNNSQIEMFLALIDGQVTQQELADVESHMVEIDGKKVTAEVAVEVDDSSLSTLDSDLSSSASGKGITVDVNANTEPLRAGIADIQPAPIEVPVKLGAVETQMPSESDISSKFDTQAADQTVQVTLEAVDNASPVVARVMQAVSALRGLSGDVQLKATDNASSVIARVMQAANALQSVSGSITLEAEDNSGSVIAQAMQAANAYAQGNYQATIQAVDNSGSVVAQAMQAANAYAAGDYTGVLNANDQASALINTVTGLANTYASGSYVGMITANDQASALIQTATDLANTFASTYTATLNAVDNASGVISSVAGQLAALDGTTATTYVETVQLGTLPAKALGGAIRGEGLPRAAMGRNVLVGEAGEEVVTLPFGSFVKPHGADGGKKPEDMFPDVNMSEAYKKGSDSAKAFYKGLYDEAKSALREGRTDINTTRFDSKGDAAKAIREYLDLERVADRLKSKIAQGAAFDDKQRARLKKFEEDTEQTADKAVKTMDTAGAEAGAEFSDSMSTSLDTGSVVDQVMKLKDEFIATMKGAGGATGDAMSAVESFNEEVANIVGGMKGLDKGTEKATEGISDSFGDVTDDAQDMGDDVGDELVKGIAGGAEEATDALGQVSQMMNQLSGQAVDPTVGIDNKKASDELKDVANSMQQLNGMSATPDVKVTTDDSSFDAFLNKVQKNAQLGVTVTVTTKEKAAKPVKQLGGQVSFERDIPHAANGRIITVGEAGEENVILPYGSMVMPHDASRSRNAADAQTSGNLQIFGNVTIVPPTSDLYNAVSAQFMSMQRD
jgi:hypothetical protein